MFSHVFLGSDDLDLSKQFYDATFGAMGGKEGFLDAKGRLIYLHNEGVFLIGKPLNGEPATFANGGTIGFKVDSPEMADAWHAAGLAAGGTAIEDAPGWRGEGSGRLYLAYLRDPTGHKLCVLHR